MPSLTAHRVIYLRHWGVVALKLSACALITGSYITRLNINEVVQKLGGTVASKWNAEAVLHDLNIVFMFPPRLILEFALKS